MGVSTHGYTAAMQNHPGSNNPIPVPAPTETTPRGLTPPLRVWVAELSLVAAVGLVRAGWLEPIVGGVVDQAVRNIITLILGFAGLMSALVWLVRESGHPSAVKRAVVGGLLAAVVLAALLLRIERVSGDLVPEFAWRWRPSRDRLLPAASTAPPPVADAGVSWPAISAGDFPRFLGPSGDCALESPVLDADWTARPPRLLWRQPIGAGWSGFASCGDHAVTLEQRGAEEIVSCRRISDGHVEWSVGVPARHQTVLGGAGPRSTPTIADGVVYAHGATGWLHAIDGATGRVLWRKNLIDELGIDPAAHAVAVAWGRSGSPLVLDDLVILPAGGPRTRREAGEANHAALVALDRSTGQRRWIAGDEQISYASPQVVAWDGRRLVVSVNEGHVAAYDPADASEVWNHPWPGHSSSDASCSQAVPVGGGRLLLSKGYGIGAAVIGVVPGGAEPWRVDEVWRNPGALKTKFTNVAIHDGHAYGLSDGVLECVRLDDGTRRWKAGRYGQGQVLRVGRLLLVQAESGEVVLVDAAPAGHVVRARLAAIEGQTWNTLCLAGTRLLVRNAEEAACYELPVVEAAARGGAAGPTESAP